MTDHAAPTTEPLARRRRHRRLIYGSLAVGILGLLVGIRLEQFLAGVLVYWAGFAGMLGVWWFSPVRLYDERETAIERRASDYTLGVFAFALVIGAPGGLVLEDGGVLTLPPSFHGSVWALVAVYTVFGVIYTVLRRRA
ncbi:DUF2178 domain-containing protein [Natronorarus salvus]|uniref:DUF2178 domain-containing protein n=1 Tax=Natronorarus salvus TaxID=3117733 RepID=UPI002F261319